MATLLAISERPLSVSEAPRPRSVNVPVSDNPGDLLTTNINNTLDTLLNSGEHYVSRKDKFVPRPERRSGRKWWETGVRESRGRCKTLLFSTPWWQVWRDAANARGRVLEFRFLSSASSFLDQAVDDLDGLGTDFDSFATYHVGLGQNRTRLWVADDKAPTKKRRTGRGRSGSRCRVRVAWGEVGRGRRGVGF